MAVLAAVGWPVVDRVFGISPHGVFIAIGFMIGAWLFGKLGPSRGIEEKAINSVVLWSLIGAIVGARVFYLIGHWSEFSPKPIESFYIWKGGITLLGGIAGAVIANAINIRRYKLRFWQVADAIAAPLALGIAVGRIGDLIIGDHLGKPTSWFLAWKYKSGTLAPPWLLAQGEWRDDLKGGLTEFISRDGARLVRNSDATTIASGVGVHQTAMYDMFLAWGLFALLWWFTSKSRREGLAAILFAIYYGCCRLLEDSLRIDKRWGPFTGSQWTALAVVIVCVGIWGYLALSKRPGATTPPRPKLRRQRTKSPPETAAAA